MNGRFTLSATTLFCAMLFSSCTEINFNVEKEIKPPLVSDEQKGIQSALADFTGGREVSLVYPKTGKYLAPFILKPDPTGKESATVFALYSVTENNKSPTKIAMLKKTPTEWSVVSSAVVSSRSNCEVEDVSFHKMCPQENEYLAITFGVPNQKTRDISIYKYSSKSLSEIEQMCHSYTSKMLADIDRDGLDELILLDRSNINDPCVIIEKPVVKGKEIGVSCCYAPLSKNENIIKDAKLTLGKLKNNKMGLFIDEVIYDETQEREMLKTELLEYTGRKTAELINRTLCYEKENAPHTNPGPLSITQRSKGIFPEDINGDGHLEIPGEIDLTDVYGIDELVILNLKGLIWRSFYGDKEKIAGFEILDDWGHYRLKLKPDWVIKNLSANNDSADAKDKQVVTLKYVPDSGGCMLSLTDSTNRVIVKINVVPKGRVPKSIFDKFAETDELDYYVYIPDVDPNENQLLYMHEFKKLFKLLK